LVLYAHKNLVEFESLGAPIYHRKKRKSSCPNHMNVELLMKL
jgi:hypothetical protein